jgi:hypothetical protein
MIGDISDNRPHARNFFIDSACGFSGLRRFGVMPVLDDFESMRLYRNRAAKFERLADACLDADVRDRYRLIAHHYTVLANMVERSDKARVTQRLEALRAMRQAVRQRG